MLIFVSECLWKSKEGLKGEKIFLKMQGILFSHKNFKQEYAQNDLSGEKLSQQLIDIGNDKMPLDALTGCITFPVNFC